MTRRNKSTKAKAANPAPFAAPDWPGLPKMRKLDTIEPYPHNARTHPPAQITLLATLLKKWGPDQAIVVDEEGIILKGHGRRLAALEAGLEEFPVVERLGLSGDDKEAMRIADNQVALLAGWDNELVSFAVKSLKRSGYDMAILGFGEAQLVQFTTTLGPPGEFSEFGEDIEVVHQCPRCGYKGSGDWTPKKKKPPAKKKKK
jgi:ParB-like nuclease domain